MERPVQNANVGPLVQKILKVSRQQLQSIKPNMGPFLVQDLCNCTHRSFAHEAKPALLLGQGRWESKVWKCGNQGNPKGFIQ